MNLSFLNATKSITLFSSVKNNIRNIDISKAVALTVAVKNYCMISRSDLKGEISAFYPNLHKTQVNININTHTKINLIPIYIYKYTVISCLWVAVNIYIVREKYLHLCTSICTYIRKWMLVSRPVRESAITYHIIYKDSELNKICIADY